MFTQLKINLRNWWERNNGERFVKRLNDAFQAAINFSLGLLLIAMLTASVAAAFCHDGWDALIYAVAAFVIAVIIRM